MDWKRLYAGFLSTPFLWKGKLNGLEQFELEDIPTPSLQSTGNPRTLLGTLAEHFSFDYWSQVPNLEFIAKNIQINGAQETLGEIDALLQYHEQTYHVEITYKVYLFDPSISENPMECWIGPNRWDRLTEKLHRIESHQLPLLHRKETQSLTQQWIEPDTAIEQRVWVKGLLFLPEGTDIDVSPLNPDSICGTYVTRKSFQKYTENRFFMPSKPEWMIVPHSDVSWLSFEKFQSVLNAQLDNKFSPLIWMKQPNGVVSRLFVVWW